MSDCATFAVALVMALAGWGGSRVRAVEAAPEDVNGLYFLTLTQALPGERAMRIYLERLGQAFGRCFGDGPDFNKMPYDVDVSGLKLAGGRLAGTVKVTVNPDNWVPKGRQSVLCAYAIEAAVADGRVTGSFTGTCGRTQVRGAVAGEYRPQPTLPEPARFELILEWPLSRDSTHWQNRAHVGFTIKGGRAVAPKVHAPNNTTYADWTCRVDSLDLKLAGGRLSGTIQAAIAGGGKWCRSGQYAFAIDADVLGDAVAGTFATRLGGEQVSGGRFLGRVAPAAVSQPAESTYDLHLHGAAADGKAMWVHLDCRKGAFSAGLAFTPRFNHAVHDVEASGLKLAEGKLTGKLRVTVNADPYVPRDGKPVACAYAIDARVADGGIGGSFTGTFGGEAVRGVVGGLYGPRPDVSGAVNVWLKMEQGVAGGAAWHNRTYIHFALKNGKVVEGKFSNNKGAWEGTFDGAEVRLRDGALTGELKCTIASGRVRKGTYVFALDGRVISSFVTGSFTSRLGGQVVQSGRFVGGIAPAE